MITEKQFQFTAYMKQIETKCTQMYHIGLGTGLGLAKSNPRMLDHRLELYPKFYYVDYSDLSLCLRCHSCGG